MNKLTYLIGVLGVLTLATSCQEEQQRGFIEPPRDYSAQSAVDNDSLISFMKRWSYNHEDYANQDNKDKRITFTIDSLKPENNKVAIFDKVQEITFRVKDADNTYHSHTAYILPLREGEGDSPTVADSVFVSYRGMLLNQSVFDERTSPMWLESLGVVKGFGALMPYIKKAAPATINSDGTYSFSGFGSAAVFMPSALGHYNNSGAMSTMNRSIPVYSPLIFAVDLYTYNTTDHDGDKVLTLLEDLDGDGYFDDDTDSDGVPNYRDVDDDNDGILTRDEYDTNNDGTPDDSDGDGTPDYLDKD